MGYDPQWTPIELRQSSILDRSSSLFGLSAQAKAQLIAKLTSVSSVRPAELTPRRGNPVDSTTFDPRLDVSEFDGFREIRMIRAAADFLGIADPFFRVHEGVASSETVIDNKAYVNFASYNYLGLNGHPYIIAAAKAAIDRYGTTVSASRPVSGERPIHRELEQMLARIHGCEEDRKSVV